MVAVGEAAAVTATPTDLNVAAWDTLHTQRRHALNYPAEPVVRFLVMSRDTLNATNMLDIGCGAGRHMKLAAELGLEPYGVDASSEALEQAKQYGPVKEGDMTALPYDDDSFDVVLAWGTLYYGTRDTTRKALLEIRRVLVVNGHALISLRTEMDWRHRDGTVIDDRTVVFSMEGEPEDGMVMNFAGEEDLRWIGDEFAGAVCEIADATTRSGARLDSDWQIVVRKG